MKLTKTGFQTSHLSAFSNVQWVEAIPSSAAGAKNVCGSHGGTRKVHTREINMRVLEEVRQIFLKCY